MAEPNASVRSFSGRHRCPASFILIEARGGESAELAFTAVGSAAGVGVALGGHRAGKVQSDYAFRKLAYAKRSLHKIGKQILRATS